MDGVEVAGIRDVAARAGVSVGTASRALTGTGPVSAASRERVEVAARELRYVASYTATALKSGRSRNIGVILPAIDRWFYGKVVTGIADELIDQGYELALYNTQGSHEHQEAVLGDYLWRQRLDAVIPVSLELTPAEITRMLSMDRPVVGVGGPMPGVCTVSIDQTAAGRLATAHLVGLGHRDIAHITGGADPERDFHLTDSRRGGFESEMLRAGLAVRDEWILRSDFTLLDAYQQAKHLLARPERPTAVFAASDEMAMGVILAARDLGLRVPDALSVIGVDGHEMGDAFGLSTIRQFPERQGARAAQLLLARLTGPALADDSHLHEALPTQFVVRSSTAAPPA
jgi:DNA-binding LacI/PurR family transcriptional regulator